jgi:para-aminobenzoate synthetase component 1
MAPADNAKEIMNQYGKRRLPFLFILDFDLQQPIVIPLEEAFSGGILFNIRGNTNSAPADVRKKKLEFKKFPVPYEEYRLAFSRVQHHLREGNTYLLNLTFPTRIETNYTLSDFYQQSAAKFKLLYKDLFVVFSPEIFIEIEDGIIASYPMKGTIDASLPGAERKIMADEKETAEHATIVDLIRNDLSMVAGDVHVERYRYIDRIKTNEKELLQVSSKITGRLVSNFHECIGNIIVQLLPAGSVTGAPKKKTVQIIHEMEQADRNYYSGVFGYFDGKRLESGVMIRFIEKQNDILYYKSGGGITALSHCASEYGELIDKVYVPIA